MRAKVYKLNRQITITKDEEDWGCRVLTTKFDNYPSGYHIEGSTTLHNVDIKGCGKANSEVHALDYLMTAEDQEVVGSVIRNSYMKCVKADSVGTFTFTDNVVHDCINMGLELKSKNAVVNNNMISMVDRHPIIQTMTKIAAFDLQGRTSLEASNNLAVGVWGAGFAYNGYDCSDSSAKDAFETAFANNVAVACQIGWIALPVNT